MKPILAIVGRPNVGKSTLFNRIIGERTAIVADMPGTTRDRLYADTEFAGREFTVVDTGGIVGEGEIPRESSGEIAKLARAQAELAISEADAILFLVDAEQGVMPGDFEIAQILRKSAKPVYVAVNKADNEKRSADAVEFYRLGLGDPEPISSLHGVGTGDLLERIVKAFPAQPPEAESEIPKIAIVGRPNVGKSSLLNAILGQERAIVSQVPGTTRDALDTEVEWRGQPVTLIDTAGLRRRGKIEPGLSKFSSLRSLKAIQRADVVLLLLDASEGTLAQDTHVASYILEENKGIVLVVNKWDLIDKDIQSKQEFTERVRNVFSFIPFAPIVFASAKTRQGVKGVVDTALRVRTELHTRVSTTELNDLLREAIGEHEPPSKGKRVLKFYYATQADAVPPTFVFFVNRKDLIHFSYQRYLENKIRERWDLTGAPIRLVFRSHRTKDR